VAGRAARRWRLVRARPEAVPLSLRRLSHTVSARRFRPRLARAWLLVALGGALVGALGWLVYATSVLGVKTVEVTGARIASAAQVREVAAVPLGIPLARVDADAVATRVLGLAPVASVDISRSWPSTLIISVTERTPVAVATSGEDFLVLDASGVVFQTVDAAPEGLIRARLAVPGPTDPATCAAVAVIMALTPQLRSMVAEVVAASAVSIRLELIDGRTVIWGDGERSDIKARVATTLLGKATERIDVSTPEVAAVS
jgi:cell division protein FtsQ